MAKKQQQNNNNFNNNNNNSNNGNGNNFFNNNPLLIFVIFSIVTIFAFKAIFPEEQMGGDGTNSNIQAFGQTSNKTVAYSDLKGLISSGKIEYVGIGNTQIKAVSKSGAGQITTFTARRVIPDDTLIPELEKNNISYGGINEENILADIAYIKVKIAYESGREPVVKDFIQRTAFTAAITDVMNQRTRESFLLFARYVESLIAYFKFYGG
mgnify:CR=1 FL=1